MAELVYDQSFCFDDLLFLDQYAEMEREDIDISSHFFQHKMVLPILSSPMDTVTGLEMADAMFKEGCLGIHHRYCGEDTLYKAASCGHPVAVSPSMGIQLILDLKKVNENLIAVMDVKHGNSKKNLDFAEELIKNGINVVSGNIGTIDGAEKYLSRGISYLRCGIGSGHACKTRKNLRVGVPQAFLIHQLYNYFDDDVTIISDGGCGNIGHICAALSLGAKFVILGKMLAESSEACNFGIYRGMASKGAMLDRRKENYFVEGGELVLEVEKSLHDILWGEEGIGPAILEECYYQGAANLQELRENAKFTVMTPNATKEGMQ